MSGSAKHLYKKKVLNEVVRGLIDYVFVYIDDILIASKNETKHKERLRTDLKLHSHSFQMCLRRY